MSMQVFIDYTDPVVTDKKELEVRDKRPRLAFIRKSDTEFRVETFHVDGEPRAAYDIDISKYAKGEIHSLQGYNTFLPYIPEDRVSMDIFLDMGQVAAAKEEVHCLHLNHKPNSVVFYIAPGTDDVYGYCRHITYFEGIEPIVVDSNNFHVILQAHCPNYEDPRPMNTLRLRTLLALDPNESLACIESQLDFVTAMLLAVVDGDPELKLRVLEKVGEYANFKDAVEPNLLFTVKEPSKCLDEIRTLKAFARQKQREYYAARAALLAAKEAAHVGTDE